MIRLATATILAATCGTTIANPDIIVGSLDTVNNYGVRDGIRAYSIGTTACNLGTSAANWVETTVNHPVISTTIWKYDPDTGRLTQLGVTQLKHSFAALQQDECTPCGPGGGWQALGPGCSDPYGPTLNGTQSDLGPRSEVNPFNGQFPYPFTGINQTGNNIFKRLQVPQSEIEDNNATFYAEGIYVIKDDFAAGTNMNNASYKQLNINQSSFNASTTGATFQQTPAIYAWQAQDPSVEVHEVDVPGDGRLIVASKVTDLGNGMYQYDYGVYNQNSDKAVSSVSIPVNTPTSGYFFKDISYHSPVDENISGADWTRSEDGSAITWTTSKFADNEMGNAVRWGTMYNYCFVTDAAPTMDQVTLGLFKAGADVTVTALVPTLDAGCVIDYNDDGDLDFFDINAFTTLFLNNDPSVDFNNDGNWDFFDINAFTTQFVNGCP